MKTENTRYLVTNDKFNQLLPYQAVDQIPASLPLSLVPVNNGESTKHFEQIDWIGDIV